jgi:hypothetical protein
LSTGFPTYWPSDLEKIPDLLDFFISGGISKSYMEVNSNFDLSSDHTPAIGTISNTVINANKVPRLHNKSTGWQTYKKLFEDKLNLKISLKTSEELEKETEKFIRVLQETFKQATPLSIIQKVTKYIPLEIKKLITAKRKARRKWHCNRSEPFNYWLEYIWQCLQIQRYKADEL